MGNCTLMRDQLSHQNKAVFLKPLENCISYIRRYQWAAKVDFTYGYFHIMFLSNFVNDIGVCIDGVAYAFNSIPSSGISHSSVQEAEL